MVSTVATHASPVSPQSGSEAKSSAAEPGFQTALSSSLQAARSGEQAASTAAPRPDGPKRPSNEPERGRPEKKGVAAVSTPAGETAPDASMTDPIGNTALPLQLSLLSTPASDPAVVTGELPSENEALNLQAVAPASAQAGKPVTPVLTAQAAGPGSLLPAKSTLMGGSEAQGLATPLDQKAATRPASGKATPEVTPQGRDASDQAAAGANGPALGVRPLAANTGHAPAHAAAAMVAPVPASLASNAGQTALPVPSLSAGMPANVPTGSTGESNSQAGSEGSQGGPKTGKNQDSATASGSGLSFSPAVTADAPPIVHATLAGVESASPVVNQSMAPTTSQPVASGSESGGRGTDASAAPGASSIAEPQPINTARVLQSMSGTEMRVGIHSQEFGSISIATSVSPSGVAAQIALDHGALSRVLATHLPAIEDKLGSALGVSARVEVRDGGAQTSQGSDGRAGGQSEGSGSQRGTQSDSAAGYAPQRSAEAAYLIAAPEGAMSQAGDGGRLSVQA